MNLIKNEIKEAFKEILDINITSIEEYFSDSFLINNTYKVIKINPLLNNNNDTKIMYALFEGDKYIEKLKGISNSNFAILKHIHRKEPLDNLNERQLSLIAKNIKKMHKKEVFDFLPTFEVASTLSSLIDNSNYKKQTINKYIRLFNSIKDKESLVISHNNLIKENILFGYDDICFTSFFDAGLNIPQYDLATIIYSFNLNDEQIDLFLKQYYGKKYSSLKKKKVLIIKEIIEIIKSKTN